LTYIPGMLLFKFPEF